MLTGYMDFFQIIQNKLLIVNMCCRKRSKSNDRIHRRADIMRHIIQKHSLRPVRMFCSRKCISQIPILRNLTFFFFCHITIRNLDCTYPCGTMIIVIHLSSTVRAVKLSVSRSSRRFATVLISTNSQYAF